VNAKGKWVSVTGIVDADYSTRSWSRTGITVVDANQLNFITEEEAQIRLAANVQVSQTSVSSPAASIANKNAQIAAAAKAAASKSSSPSRSSSYSSGTRKPRSGSRSSYGKSPSRQPSYSPRPYSPPPKKEVNWVFWGIAIAVVALLIFGGL
jgi:cobalamin biosynthesis Mg chelatase CobN